MSWPIFGWARFFLRGWNLAVVYTRSIGVMREIGESLTLLVVVRESLPSRQVRHSVIMAL